jgi:uncharacterized protein YukE
MNLIRRHEPETVTIQQSAPAAPEVATLPDGTPLNHPLPDWPALNRVEAALSPALEALNVYRAAVKSRQATADNLRYKIWICHKRISSTGALEKRFQDRIDRRTAKFARLSSAPDALARLSGEVAGFNQALAGLADAVEALESTIEQAEAELATLLETTVEVPAVLRNFGC